MSTNKSSSLRFSDLAPSIKASALRRKEDKSDQSFNKHRKNTVFDKEVAHQVLDTTELKREHESDEDDDNEDTDSRVTIRDRQFEFSDGRGIMRLIRMLIVVQIIGILVDSSSITLSAVFKISCRGLLFYSIRFYSRPFLDIVYIIQYFFATITEYFNNQKQNTSSQSTSYVISDRRRLTNYTSSPTILPTRSLEYITVKQYSKAPLSHSFIIDFLDPSNWHSIKHWTHFFLGPLFVILAAVLTFYLWEISDYSNRGEVRKWLSRFVSDGWWRRGGWDIVRFTILCYLLFAFSAWLLFALAMQFNQSWVPPADVLGTVFLLGLSVTFLTWLLSYMGIRMTEAAFLRYVSQNVSYTSQIILKRAVKSKIELGILLMSLMYMPVLYTLIQSVIVITDWNDLTAQSFRKDFNYYVPCYFMAFPPHRKQQLPSSSCPMASYSSPLQKSSSAGFFLDSNILQCDSYLGIIIFVLSAVLIALIITGYFYTFYTTISLVATEFQESKFVETLGRLMAYRDRGSAEYKLRFSFWSRFSIAFCTELALQVQYQFKAIVWLGATVIFLVRGIFQMIVSPIVLVSKPLWYLGRTLVTITWLNTLTADGKARKKQLEILRKTNKTATEVTPIEVIEADSTSKISSFSRLYNALNFYRHFIYAVQWFGRAFCRTNFAVCIRMSFQSCKNIFINDASSMGLAKFGGSTAPWRLDQSLASKSDVLAKMNHYVDVELRKAMKNFVAEHELFYCSFFDRCVDSAGISILIAPFRYYHTQWFLVILTELSLYAIVGAIFKQYTAWTTRNLIFLFINCLFGLITYISHPYVEMFDRWLEYSGRLLIFFISIGLVITAAIEPAKIKYAHTALYDSGSNASYFFGKGGLFDGFGFYDCVDLCMALAFYAYIIYVLFCVGFFHVFQRMIRNALFIYHDHVFDFLVEFIDQKAIGMDNIFSGFRLIQQWDDIIKIQRRYAFLTWPDVRPPHLVSTFVKLLEIKWASLFNLTVKSMRSSLGLTLLHTAMFSANSEAAKWLLYSNPELITVQDSQNDTPVTIALKECAYFLLAYGQQNDGQMDDGTSYSDEKFADYYPEVEDIRESIYERGEFLEDRCTVANLTVQDLLKLRDEGYYVEPPPVKEVDDYYLLKAKMMTTNSKRQKEQLALELERREEIQRKKRNTTRRLEAAVAAEKKAMHGYRFPEDLANDNLEAGQLSSWLVLGLTVPDINIFIDHHIATLLRKDPTYNYTQPIPGIPAYMQYVVPSSRPMRELGAHDVLVPFTHVGLKDMPDFNKRRRRRALAREVATRESDVFSATSGGAQSSVNSDESNKQRQSSSFLKLGHLGSQHRRTEVADREARWNICKFAEILLSEEITNGFKTIEWSIADYKEFNKMASAAQGRIVQNLAYCCHLNPPDGFTRISDWHRGSLPAVFDDPPEIYVSSVVKRVATAVEVVDKAASLAGQMVSTVLGGANDISSMVRGRARRTRRRSTFNESRSGSGEGGPATNSSILSDRIVQFLAEAFVCSTDRVSLEDCELSYEARIGWRAIVRALRKKNCSFISPSMFVSPRPILIRYLHLPKNELDCGDAVYLADIFVKQQLLVSIDLSFNRIGARGCGRMMRALREAKHLQTLRLDHNTIGPAAGKDIASFLKNSQLKVLTMSYNSLGEIARFPTLFTREKISSAVNDIFLGVRLNTSLRLLDVSYNHLGPGCADAVPPAVLRHPYLTCLNLSGNSIGSKAGSHLIFSLAGFPQGVKFAQDMQHFISMIRSRQLQGAKISENDVRAGMVSVIKESDSSVEPSATPPLGPGSGNLSPGLRHAGSGSPHPSPALNKSPQNADDCIDTTRAAPLASLSLADNRLGPFCGYALASMLERNSALTDIDVSGNALGFGGGEAVSDQLELCYGLKPREFVKRCLYDIDQKKYEGRNAKKKKMIFTNLTNLNMARNGLGPTVTGTIALCLGQGGCTLTSLDLSDNPLGYSAKNGGIARDAGLDLKIGLRTSSTLAFLDLSQSTLQPSEMIPMFSGMALNISLLSLQLRSLRFDEPSCLQLCTVLAKVSTLTSLNLHDCSMGSNGAFLIACKVRLLTDRLKFLDLTGISMGPVSAIQIGEAIADPDCAVQTLRIARNDIMDEGGFYVCKGLMGNTSLTELDVGYNHLGEKSATHLADAIRGYYLKGVKVSDCQLKRISLSGNSMIGSKAARALVRALANYRLTHLEMADVGALPGLAKMLSIAFRDPSLGWEVCDISGNKFGRSGCNQIFWALRQNKRLRVLRLGQNQQGTLFCSNEDALLKHGIAVTKLLSINVVLRELDLSFSSITTDGAMNILDALIESHSLKTLSLRGNLLDDNLALSLSELLRCNNVLEDLDLGRNRLGFTCCYAIAEGLEINRSLKTLRVDFNRFGGAGTATLDSFCRSMMLNCNLKALLLDGNRLGPEWGVRLAEAIARNGSLIQLSLRDNRLDLRAGEALLRAFKKAEYLVELALSADEVGEMLWEEFRREFASKRSSIHPDSLIQETKLTAKQLHLMESYGF